MSALRCYLVDDEELPLSSLERMLRETRRVEIAGASTDPAVALAEIQRLRPDALFLDIHMPQLDGFQLLAALPSPPLVVFTTAYDHHAVRAFEVNSVDYLLKPVNSERLLESIARLERQLEKRDPAPPPLDRILETVAAALQPREWLKRVGTQSGDSVSLLDVDEISHFVSEDRYTYACTDRGRFLVGLSLGDLEARLSPAQFLRIHRSALVNLQQVAQISRWFAGRVLVRLRNRDRTELPVSRDKVAALRRALGVEVRP
jgi:two-component system LytT family response regulator